MSDNPLFNPERMEVTLFVSRSLTEEWDSLSDEDKIRSKNAYELMLSSHVYSMQVRNLLKGTRTTVEKRPGLYEENLEKIKLFIIH